MKFYRVFKWADTERGWGDDGTVTYIGSETEEGAKKQLAKRFGQYWHIDFGMTELTKHKLVGFLHDTIADLEKTTQELNAITRLLYYTRED